MLTVSHVIHQEANQKPQLLVFAGDTAGKVSVWNATTDIQRYMNEALGSELTDDYQDETKEHVLVKDGGDSSSKTGDHGEHRMSAHVADHVSGEVAKSREHHVIVGSSCEEEACSADSTDTARASCLNVVLEDDSPKSSDSDSDSDSEFFEVDMDICRSPPNASLPVSIPEEAKWFSCMTLVRDFLAAPVHVFKAHQSGVNDVSLLTLTGA